MKIKICAVAVLVALTTSLPAAAAPKSKVDPAYLRYEQPGILAKIAGGQIVHLKCMGTGFPTVVLTAGMGDWAATWRKVQPQIARTTRVCAWDRPGFGFSSGTLKPQTVAATTAALESALKIAHVRGPYIAVGHSLGGYESILFKDRNPTAVVGMVLVDPSIPNQHTRLALAAPQFAAFGDEYNAKNIAFFDGCLAGFRSGKLKLGSPDPDQCLAYAPDYPPELAKALAFRDTDPLRFTAGRSLLANFNSDGESVVNARRNFGDMPLIVLSASKVSDAFVIPPAAKAQTALFHAEFVRGHDELASLSSRGVNRLVPDATHYIQNDQPQAVIEAISEVVAAARSTSRSRNRRTTRH